MLFYTYVLQGSMQHATCTTITSRRQLIMEYVAACVLCCRRQAVAGLLYAGPLKSMRYLMKKLAKAWK